MKTLLKTSIILICSILILFLASCATTVNVRLTRPAQLDLNGAKTIAVLPFKPSNYYREYESSRGIEITVYTFYQIFDIKLPDEQLTIDSLHSQIERGLVNSKYLQLVSSDSVEKALRKGSLNPADVYLTGEVVYFKIHDDYSEEKKMVKAAQGNSLAEYQIFHYWKREVSFNFRYQIVDSTTDKVIAYNEYRCNTSSAKYDSKRSLPSAYSLLESNINVAARKILKELQPYTVTKSIQLLDCKTKDKALKERMKAADKLADDNQFAEASKAFQNIYEETGNVEAGYNAAILQEAMGNLSEAETMMTALYNSQPDPRVYKGLTDIRYEINQAKRLQKQLSSSSDSEILDAIEESEDLDLDF